jgi:CubicO group peptidase (beta-lactamase class C family)
VDGDVVLGMAVGVVKNDETLVRGYGYLSTADRRTPDGKTVFEIGSASKVFTGILLADAVVRKHLTLDQPVQSLLPEKVSIPQFGEEPIRLIHLATHSSGLPRMPDDFETAAPSNPYADYSADRLYGSLRTLQLQRKPGAKIEYSNLGAGLLGHVLSLHANKSFESLMQDQITKPLQMSDTVVEFSKELLPRVAPGHRACFKTQV